VVSLNLKTMEKLSKHVSYKEGVYSRTAERLGLKNDPSDAHLANMKLIAEKVFEPLREHVGGPIKINSFYRGPELNAAIGGSAKSQHCHGQAIDIDDTFGHATNAEMFYWIQQNLDFDQMIWEFGTETNPNWVHISYVSPEENRKRCLKAYKDNGKTKYMVI
jgi:zinc D-Ala-D-Ala carboxypeptidase